MTRIVQLGDDEALVARLAAGDELAMANFYDRYAGLVLAIAQRMLRDRGEAEALAEDCFVELWQRAAQYERGRGSVATWVATLVRSRGIDRLRARQRRLERHSREDIGSTPVIGTSDPAQDVLRADDRQRLRHVLDGLGGDQRQALELCYFEGLSHNEVAIRLSRPLGTVKTYIREGLIHLRRMLRTDDEEGSP